MPFAVLSNELWSTSNNWGATASSTPGTSVTPGASNAEGTYVTLFNNITETLGFHVRVADGATSTAAKNHLLDIGVDPANGTSFTAIISNICCGASQPTGTTGTGVVGHGHMFFFPYFIPGGASIGVRIQGSNATAGTVRVSMKLYTSTATRPWHLPCGQFSETLGTITNSNGVSFTPGNAADGTWTSLGTTSRDLWWWQLAYQIDNGTVTNQACYIELGAGASGTQRVLQRRLHIGSTGEMIGDVMNSVTTWHEGYHPIPAGTELWVRGRCSASPDAGYNAVAIGVGG